MSVYKRTRMKKDGTTASTWMVQVEWRHPDGTKRSIRRKSPVQTKRGAEKYEREVRAALADGSYGKERRAVPLFGDFAEEFMANYVMVNNKHSTVLSKRTIFNHHLVPFFRKKRLDQIGIREIERYKALKRPTHNKKTINNHLTVLRKMLVCAQEWELIEHVPRIKWLRAPKPDIEFLDFDEAGRVLDALRDEPLWHTMVLVAMKTGLRHGELLGLRWRDVDLNVGRLVVRQAVARGVVGTPKSHRSREVPLSRGCVHALRAHPRHLHATLVFTKQDGSMLSRHQGKRQIERARVRAGVTKERIGWHMLRHTFASHLVMRGAPLKSVQELMGHATIEMTMRYAHLSPSVRRDAVELLDLVG